MPPFVDQFLGFLKIAPRSALIGLLSVSAFLFAPIAALENSKLLNENRDWLMVLWVVFLAICIGAVVIHVGRYIHTLLKERKNRIARENVIRLISSEEKDFIRPYFREGIRTLELDIEHISVVRLVRADILYQLTGRVMRTIDDGTLTGEFSVSDWAWDVVNKNSRLKAWVLRKD